MLSYVAVLVLALSMVPSFFSLLASHWFGADKQGSDEEVFPMCGVFPFATRTQPVKHEGYVKVSQVVSCTFSC